MTPPPSGVQWSDADLTLTLAESADELRLAWMGKSNSREPGRFLMPVLLEVLRRAGESGRRLVMDFTDIEYMNSSSFAPVAKLLGEAQRGQGTLTLEYSQDRRWQALSFAALRAFETPDGRIKLIGR
jgi:hypothetical protein